MIFFKYVTSIHIAVKSILILKAYCTLIRFDYMNSYEALRVCKYNGESLRKFEIFIIIKL